MIFKARDTLISGYFFCGYSIWIDDKVILYFLTPFLLIMIFGRYEFHVHEDELLFKIKLLQFVLYMRKPTHQDYTVAIREFAERFQSSLKFTWVSKICTKTSPSIKLGV